MKPFLVVIALLAMAFVGSDVVYANHWIRQPFQYGGVYVWSDTARCCPTPGMVYAQVLTPLNAAELAHLTPTATSAPTAQPTMTPSPTTVATEPLYKRAANELGKHHPYWNVASKEALRVEICKNTTLFVGADSVRVGLCRR